ncbi:hypothetical protein [Streptomyces canus]|uniref:hypothetical protein n=1 Tax=Streptomyces canus TaxID=58343 RepID=UPI002782D793|nr:hypothetical protein [Streptomyces canus]MDQ1068781.1 NTP pyrophosphatase (non-canonical NTP hydrolase) [Streptomyces canus]
MNEDLKDLQSQAAKGLAAVRELQAQYDVVGWQIKNPEYAKIRHVLLHLMKITADVAAIVEHVEHCVQNEVDPEEISRDFAVTIKDRGDIAGDLLFHAAQFANLGDYDLADQLIQVYARNSKRFAPDSPFADLGPLH